LFINARVRNTATSSCRGTRERRNGTKTAKVPGRRAAALRYI
jgi:hypothetical protein